MRNRLPLADRKLCHIIWAAVVCRLARIDNVKLSSGRISRGGRGHDNHKSISINFSYWKGQANDIHPIQEIRVLFHLGIDLFAYLKDMLKRLPAATS